MAAMNSSVRSSRSPRNVAEIDVRGEILVDFTGDALADPQFLKTLAAYNPSKFGPFLQSVVSCLESIARKWCKPGFGSLRYFVMSAPWSSRRTGRTSSRCGNKPERRGQGARRNIGFSERGPDEGSI
jgi:hypothetical protein